MEEQIKVFVVANSWLDKILRRPSPAPTTMLERGWGNGYITIPKGHPWYGQPLNADCFRRLQVKGVLSFAEFITERDGPGFQHYRGEYVIGFHTAHASDNKERWNEAEVMMEAIRLKEQAMAAYRSLSA